MYPVYALTDTIFGGTAEFFALSFKEAGYETWFFIYVTIMIFISLLVYVFMKDTKHHSKIQEHWSGLFEDELLINLIKNSMFSPSKPQSMRLCFFHLVVKNVSGQKYRIL